MYECVFPLCESAVTHPSRMLWTFFHNILPETFSWLHTIHCMDCWILVHQFSWFCTLLPKVFQKLFLMSLDTFFLTFWGFSCRWRTTESKILHNFTIFTLTLRWWSEQTPAIYSTETDWLHGCQGSEDSLWLHCHGLCSPCPECYVPLTKAVWLVILRGSKGNLQHLWAI